MSRRHPVLLALLGLLLLAVAPGLMGARTPYVPIGTPSPRYQVKKYVIKMAPQSAVSMQGSGNSNWSAAWAAKDYVVNLPADSVAWDYIACQRFSGSADRIPGAVRDSLTQGDSLRVNQACGVADVSIWGKMPTIDTDQYQQLALLWFPFERYLPARSTVMSAKLHLTQHTVGSSSGTFSTGGLDTLFPVLLNRAGDGAWRHGTQIQPTRRPGLRCASWINQRQPRYKGFSSSASYPATGDSFPWSPSLNSRPRSTDYGVRGAGYSPSATITAGTAIPLDVTYPVQRVLNGDRNNGFAIMMGDNTADGTGNFRFTGFINAADPDSNEAPWLEVDVIVGKHSWGPWPDNKQVAFVFVADGAYKSSNDAWSAIFAARGLSYTIAPVQALVEAGTSAGYDDIYRYFSLGMEIASEGRQANPYGGTDARGMAEFGFTSAGYDSLVWAMDPAWLDSAMAIESGSAEQDSAYFAGHTRVGKSFVLPNHGYNLNVLAVADSLGYLGCRSYLIGDVSRAYGQANRDTAGAYRSPGGSTSASGYARGFGMTCPRRVNLILVPLAWAAGRYCGLNAAGKITDSTVVKEMIRRDIEDRIVNGQNALWVLYAHRLVSDPLASNDGIDADQMRWILNALQDDGRVWITNLQAALTHWRSWADEVDHPAWGGATWQSRLSGNRKVWVSAPRWRP